MSKLQELIYKSANGWVKKAIVTVVFDNSDKKNSPNGYESFDTLTISRQVIFIIFAISIIHYMFRL